MKMWECPKCGALNCDCHDKCEECGAEIPESWKWKPDKQDEMLNEQEQENKARKRTRGPYRKSDKRSLG